MSCAADLLARESVLPSEEALGWTWCMLPLPLRCVLFVEMDRGGSGCQGLLESVPLHLSGSSLVAQGLLLFSQAICISTQRSGLAPPRSWLYARCLVQAGAAVWGPVPSFPGCRKPLGRSESPHCVLFASWCCCSSCMLWEGLQQGDAVGAPRGHVVTIGINTLTLIHLFRL